ncbi:unnamed protein product [Parnassius apollo]|uniref:(apollo) hypothetical protein n=1 Tax=Parnassius apollo TaxID=110799 RepID=A0A8S3WQC7_PARAO|nr:unnamed protein product [Parnassius apollo]
MISLITTDEESNIDDDEDEYDDNFGYNSSKLIRGGTLVVCPASLMQQWAGKVAQHCRSHAVSVFQHHGAARAQQPQPRHLRPRAHHLQHPAARDRVG